MANRGRGRDQRPAPAEQLVPDNEQPIEEEGAIALGVHFPDAHGDHPPPLGALGRGIFTLTTVPIAVGPQQVQAALASAMQEDLEFEAKTEDEAEVDLGEVVVDADPGEAVAEGEVTTAIGEVGFEKGQLPPKKGNDEDEDVAGPGNN